MSSKFYLKIFCVVFELYKIVKKSTEKTKRAYFSIFDYVCQHANNKNIFLPNHAPEINNCIGFGSLRRYITFLLLIALFLEKKKKIIINKI